MRMLDLIAKKRDGGEHSPEELAFIAGSAGDGSVPDYQLSAWLMAVCCRGMSARETAGLTRAMAGSGRTLRLGSLAAAKVDKHSTGGVGDGISLPLAPAVAAAGLVVPMMSGRGLGHTGGTLDKLESVAGFRVRLPAPSVERQLRRLGLCLFGQSADLAPADRRLYALRDASATVQSTPLIVASILSKKLAEDLDALVLDVKCGSGAIFPDAASAELLARALVSTAAGLGLKCVGLLTPMEQPLGLAVGNALELRQAVEVLRGDRSPADYLEVMYALGGWMLHLGGRARSPEDGARRLEAVIRSGAAAEKLKAVLRAQGGDASVVDDPGRLPRAAMRASLKAPRSGRVLRLDARAIGWAAVALGAGRDRQEDALDYGAGLLLRRKLGDEVRTGDEVATLFASDRARLRRGLDIAAAGLAVGPGRPRIPKAVLKVVR